MNRRKPRSPAKKEAGHALLHTFLRLIHERFSLEEDLAGREHIQANLAQGAVIRGSSLWILSAAIIIASVGLNVNSTPVIIGAMLISPLMGPIIAFAFGLGTSHLTLMRLAFRNLAYATGISLVSSTLYFYFTPLTAAHSELLARTAPTVWDVIIALAGGMAGMIALTRRGGPSTAVSGVAIATALMPPLCTAGYGLATAQPVFFAGALYLFVLNSVYIAFGGLAITKLLRLPAYGYVDAAFARLVRRWIGVVLLATLIPSVYLGYRLVAHEIRLNNANRFVQSEMRLPESPILSYALEQKDGVDTLEVVLVGAAVGEERLQGWNATKARYGLADVALRVVQPTAVETARRMAELKSSLVDMAAVKAGLEGGLPSGRGQEAILAEIRALLPAVSSGLITVSPTYAYGETDRSFVAIKEGRVAVAVLRLAGRALPDRKERRQLEDWLKARLGVKEARVFYE